MSTLVATGVAQKRPFRLDEKYRSVLSDFAKHLHLFEMYVCCIMAIEEAGDARIFRAPMTIMLHSARTHTCIALNKRILCIRHMNNSRLLLYIVELFYSVGPRIRLNDCEEKGEGARAREKHFLSSTLAIFHRS